MTIVARLLLIVVLLLFASDSAVYADEVDRNQNWVGRNYRSVTRSNWKIMIEEDLAAKSPDVAEKAMARLVLNLDKVMLATPAQSHADFTRLTFYLMDGSESSAGGRNSGLSFYRANAPNFRHNLDPNWNDVVVVYSAKNYVHLTDLWALKCLMHELAHAYQLHHWPEKEPGILSAWQNAVSTSLYHNVPDVNGKTLPEAYAVRNQLEYFAELSAAYFVGINYYPYDRNGLAKYDPIGCKMIERYWRI